MIRIWAAISVVMFMLAGCASMPKRPDNLVRGDYTYTRDYITWLIKNEMLGQDVTGLSIALVDDQRVVWAAGFGYADEANRIPATPETLYRVGSLSKLFTATSVMQLVEQGRMDIDKPLQTYLPEFSIKSRFGDSAPITPRSIMTHHSGLPSELLKGMWAKQPESLEENVNLLRDEYVANPPNYIFSYSNAGVSLLGRALERVVQRDFAGYMSETLLRPLGMYHSAFSPTPNLSVLGAKAYRMGKEADELPLRDLPAGGLNSSVLDLSRFMEMVFAKGQSGAQQIIKPETLAEMLRPQNSDVPLDLNFHIGLGWMLDGSGRVDIRNAGPVAHHSGATLYHRSQLIVLPEQKLGVVVLSNSATAGPVINKVSNEMLRLALDAKSGLQQPEKIAMPVKPGTMSDEELQAYVGRYATMAGVLDISKQFDALRVGFMGRSLRLEPRDDGRLRVRYKLFGLVPLSLGELDQVGVSRASLAGREIIKASLPGEEMLVGERIRPVPIPTAMQKRVGEYDIINARDEAVMIDGIRLYLDRELLMMEYGMPLFSDAIMSVALRPLNDNEAVIYGLGRGMGETVRAVTVGGEELLSYSGYLLRKRQK